MSDELNDQTGDAASTRRQVLAELADLLQLKNEVDAEIAGLIGRPCQIGHLGEFIASHVFQIQLHHSAVIKGSDGFFTDGPLAGKRVNIKWYGKLESLLDVNEDAEVDYYLVMAGPRSAAVSSRGGSRPWLIDHVFLFDSRQLEAALRERGVKIGVASSIASAYWNEAEVFPRQKNDLLLLSPEQRELLKLFGSSPGSTEDAAADPRPDSAGAILESSQQPPRDASSSSSRQPGRASTTTLFDAYLMVDWSGSSTPKRGQDSIWYALLAWDQGRLGVLQIQNPPTRAAATKEIGELLVDLTATERSVLVGFDFPYGYPVGTAEALGQAGERPWREIWDLLGTRILDQPNNKNNRFSVAAGLNGTISGGPFPFWACPGTRESNLLTAKRGVDPGIGLPEYRLTDRRIRGPQPTWKLGGVGSVGSQALLGIPRVRELRDDARLASISRVWPFEDRGGVGWWRQGPGCLVLHAEIYPSIVSVCPQPGKVKDELQVLQLAEHFGRLDQDEELWSHLAAPTNLTPDERAQVEDEEGWILGVL